MTYIISTIPFIISLFALISAFRAWYFFRVARNKREAKYQRHKEYVASTSATFFIVVLLLSLIACYFAFGFGVKNFPAAKSYYTFTPCQKAELKDYLDGNSVLRFKHIAQAVAACEK